jgi:hypothetical protein
MDLLTLGLRFIKNMELKGYIWVFALRCLDKQWQWQHILEFMNLFGGIVTHMNLK